MATYEEKILAYLDDSLSGEEREDVRAQISGGDARATRLFGAHLRLQELYGLAAKPVSAPLALQRELASKVPVLALKLPYLAMPEERRKRAAGWFWELPSFRMNAFLILLAALLLGGIWFAMKNRSNGPIAPGNSPRSTITSGTTSSGNAPQNSSTANAPQNVVPPTTNAGGATLSSRASSLKATHSSNGSHQTLPSSSGNTPQNVSPRNMSAEGAAIPSRTHSLKSAHSSNFTQELYSSDLSHRTNSTHSLTSRSSGSAKSNSLQSQNATPPNPVARRESDIASQKASEAALPFVAPQKEEDIHSQEELHSIADLHSIEVPQPSTMFHASEAMPIPIRSGQEKSYTPLRAFVEENIRFTRLAPQTRPSDVAQRFGVWQSSITSEGAELGIDYETSPWIAIGVRAGDARFIQEQQVSHEESKSGGYSHLSSEVTETALLDLFAAWACAAATYTPNPGERLEYSFTAGAGDIFAGGFSPTVLGEASVIYKASNAFALRASISYQAAWTVSANPVTLSSSNSTGSVSGSAIQSVTSTLYPSQSLGISVGVMFHP